MKMLNINEVASVKIFEIQVTEDELDVYERCMRYIYENFVPTKIEEICGAYDDELLGMYEQISSLLEKYTDIRPSIEK